MLDHLDFWPDVIHCNDWQTALIPIYLKDDGVRVDRLRSIRTVLTIHNIEYQGRYGRETLGDLFGLDHGWADDGTILMDGDVNLLKAAILCADAVNAVSPTYANELKYAYYAHGMESILRRCDYKLSGVLNGIDMKRYDPARDPLLTAPYSAADPGGKQQDKAHLQQLMGLREEPCTPVIGMVSRLVTHKGLDLVCEVLRDIMELPVQVVILGKGDWKYEEFFDWAARQYPGRMAVRLDYSEELSMAIYSGADLFLMPSRSEPCGLSQMIAMRYGTVPIVRETGGLKDTVQPYEAWRDAGTGFTFSNYSSGDMLYVIRSAVGLYRDYPEIFARLRTRAMECDFSWARSAREYLRIYSTVTGQPAAPRPGPEPVPAETESPAPAAAAPAPAETESPAPAAAAPVPAETESPAPAATAPAPAEAESPAPAAAAPAPAETESPAPAAAAPVPAETESPVPAETESPAPAETESPAPAAAAPVPAKPRRPASGGARRSGGTARPAGKKRSGKGGTPPKK
jgi:starch synthase